MKFSSGCGCVLLSLVLGSGLVCGCGMTQIKQGQDIQGYLDEAQRHAQVDSTDAQARRFADLAIAVAPGSIRVYIPDPNAPSSALVEPKTVADVFASVGDDSALADYMQQAIKKFPNDPLIDIAYQTLEDAQGRLGRVKEQKATSATLAGLLHNKLLSPGANDPAGLKCAQAQADWDSGNAALGAAEYRQAMLGYSKDARPPNGLAYSYAVANSAPNLHEALLLAQQALLLAPAQVQAGKVPEDQPALIQDTLGWVQYRLGRYKEAEANLQQAAAAVPRQAEVRYHLGMVYLAEGRTEAARIELTHATLLSKGYAAAQSELARLPKPAPVADDGLPKFPA